MTKSLLLDNYTEDQLDEECLLTDGFLNIWGTPRFIAIGRPIWPGDSLNVLGRHHVTNPTNFTIEVAQEVFICEGWVGNDRDLLVAKPKEPAPVGSGQWIDWRDGYGVTPTQHYASELVGGIVQINCYIANPVIMHRVRCRSTAVPLGTIHPVPCPMPRGYGQLGFQLFR